jgi:hypothetical protein
MHSQSAPGNGSIFAFHFKLPSIESARLKGILTVSPGGLGLGTGLIPVDCEMNSEMGFNLSRNGR